MRFCRKAAVLCALCLSFTASAAAQFGHQGPRAPKMPTPFKPVIGSGAEYQFTGKGENADFDYAVVGKEQVGANEGYWLEIRVHNSKMKGEMVMKELTVVNGSQPEIKRLIMQPPGHPPIEMPSSMMGMMRGMSQHPQPEQDTGSRGMGEEIGTESITVPAGTFECDHYRKQESGGTVDFWISSKVSPYGVVKMVRNDTTMVLQEVLTNETSHIKGEPQQMPHF